MQLDLEAGVIFTWDDPALPMSIVGNAGGTVFGARVDDVDGTDDEIWMKSLALRLEDGRFVMLVMDADGADKFTGRRLRPIVE